MSAATGGRAVTGRGKVNSTSVRVSCYRPTSVRPESFDTLQDRLVNPKGGCSSKGQGFDKFSPHGFPMSAYDRKHLHGCSLLADITDPQRWSSHVVHRLLHSGLRPLVAQQPVAAWAGFRAETRRRGVEIERWARTALQGCRMRTMELPRLNGFASPRLRVNFNHRWEGGGCT